MYALEIKLILGIILDGVSICYLQGLGLQSPKRDLFGVYSSSQAQ